MKRIPAVLMLCAMLISSLPWNAGATPPFPKEMQKALNELVGAKGYSYSANDAIDVLLDQYLTERPTPTTPRQAMNSVQAKMRLFGAERDSLVSMICFVMDDNVKRSQSNGANIDTIRTALFSVGQSGRPKPWRFPIGFTVEPQSMLHSDTTTAGLNTNLSKYDFANLVRNYGCDIYGTTGYDEQGGWAHGVTGKIATGAFTSLNQFETNLALGLSQAVLDSCGFYALDPNYRAVWMSWSNSSCTWFQKAILHKYGIEFGISSGTLSASGSGSGERPNYLWPVQGQLNLGLSANVAGRFTSVLPGMLPDRYEIAQAIAETSDSSGVRETIQKCVALRGSGVVVNLHNFALWSTNLAGNNAGDLSTVSGVMSLIAKYVRQGRLRVVTPTEFCQTYFCRSIGPSANWLQANFRDTDGDGSIDNWVTRGTTGSGFPNGAVNMPSNGTGAFSAPAAGGYRGRKEVALKWSGVSKIGNPGAGYATDPAGSNRTQAWTSGADAAVLPGPPRGWTAHFEMAVRADTTKTSGNRSALGDSVGVEWFAVGAGNWNKRRQGVGVTFKYLRDMNLSYEPTSSFGSAGDAVAQPHVKLAGRDRVGGPNAKFAIAEFEYEVPDWCDVLYVTVWKGGRSETEAIRISDVFLGFRPRDPFFIWSY